MANLSATGVKQAKASTKPIKLSDGGGLYLLVKANGSKYWRYDYRYLGKRKTLALGVYPDTTLADARRLHGEARQTLARGVDPSEAKKLDRFTKQLASSESFEAIAFEWFQTRMSDKSEKHRQRTKRAIEKDLIPALGRRAIREITAPELLFALRKIEARGAIETAHRVKQTAGQIFRFAVATGRAERDPTPDLKEALQTSKKKHLAAITDPNAVGPLLAAIDEYQGTIAVKTALQLSPLLFQRPGEIRSMEWSEINWQDQQWEIPARKMKMDAPHIVPLSTQATRHLRFIHDFTGQGIYVFPSARGASRPLSDNGVRTALRSLGYDNDTMTPHGFRAMARTILDEILGYRVDYIEHQLAHAVRDSNGRAYNRTAHLKPRRAMMQRWADYLDELRENAQVNSSQRD